jgi:phosphatidylglycerophosphatase GEP4
MVQSINTKAIMTLASIMRRPGLLVPHVSCSSISEIDFENVKESAGIQAIVFDKDNTITSPYENSIHPLADPGLKRAIQVFGSKNVAILSNSAGTLDDPDYKDAKAIESALGIAVIRHEEKKPGGLNAVLQHFDLAEPATVCVVGDRVLTDVVFGNLYGLLTIHTLPLCKGKDNVKDNWTAKILRPLENALLYKFGRRLLTRFRRPHKFWQGEDKSPLTVARKDL